MEGVGAQGVCVHERVCVYMCMHMSVCVYVHPRV